MADGQPFNMFKYVKVHKTQKPHLHPSRDRCVQYERNPQWVSKICPRNKTLSDNRHIKGKYMADGQPFNMFKEVRHPQTDGRTFEATPIPPPQLRGAEDKNNEF